ncbi:MAG: GNAT family N-acetyltransferase [Nitrospiraceae bacterium]|nr:MAG: GNAT family N-acetyltransferase [Nitrospiraceae bacterium]
MSFTVNIVSDAKELTEIFRLRYKVHCLEWGFEKPENYPDGLLTDNYDHHALHFTARDDHSQKLVGAIRLLFDKGEGFPIEKYCELDINTNEIPREKISEISRTVIHRDYRRRTEDKYIYGPDEERRSIGSFAYSHNYSYARRYEDRQKYKPNAHRVNTQIERRERHEIIISLFKAIYRESKRRELTHWYAVMTKGIVALLDKFGLAFKEIGDPVDYHGIRTPYISELRKIEEEMSVKDPKLYEEFSRGL